MKGKEAIDIFVLGLLKVVVFRRKQLYNLRFSLMKQGNFLNLYLKKKSGTCFLKRITTPLFRSLLSLTLCMILQKKLTRINYFFIKKSTHITQFNDFLLFTVLFDLFKVTELMIIPLFPLVSFQSFFKSKSSKNTSTNNSVPQRFIWENERQ